MNKEDKDIVYIIIELIADCIGIIICAVATIILLPWTLWILYKK